MKIPFDGTLEQAAALRELIASHRDDPGALMPIMQGAQEIYGYLPLEVQKVIAQNLEIPIAQVYSTATFYSQFALTPKGKYRIAVCLGTACYVKGSGLIHERITELLGIANGGCTEDGLFSMDDCRCIGACGLAPVMLINEDVYGRITVDDVEGILDKYRAEYAHGKGGDVL